MAKLWGTEGELLACVDMGFQVWNSSVNWGCKDGAAIAHTSTPPHFQPYPTAPNRQVTALAVGDIFVAAGGARSELQLLVLASEEDRKASSSSQPSEADKAVALSKPERATVCQVDQGRDRLDPLGDVPWA